MNDKTFQELQAEIIQVAGVPLTDDQIHRINNACREYNANDRESETVQTFIMAQLFAGTFAGRHTQAGAMEQAAALSKLIYKSIKK